MDVGFGFWVCCGVNRTLGGCQTWACFSPFRQVLYQPERLGIGLGRAWSSQGLSSIRKVENFRHAVSGGCTHAALPTFCQHRSTQQMFRAAEGFSRCRQTGRGYNAWCFWLSMLSSQAFVVSSLFHFFCSRCLLLVMEHVHGPGCGESNRRLFGFPPILTCWTSMTFYWQMAGTSASHKQGSWRGSNLPCGMKANHRCRTSAKRFSSLANTTGGTCPPHCAGRKTETSRHDLPDGCPELVIGQLADSPWPTARLRHRNQGELSGI